MNWMRYHLPSSGQNSSACRPCSAGVTSSAVSRRPVGSGCRPGVGAGQGAGWLRCEVRNGHRQPAHAGGGSVEGWCVGGQQDGRAGPLRCCGVAVAVRRPEQPALHCATGSPGPPPGSRAAQTSLVPRRPPESPPGWRWPPAWQGPRRRGGEGGVRHSGRGVQPWLQARKGRAVAGMGNTHRAQGGGRQARTGPTSVQEALGCVRTWAAAVCCLGILRLYILLRATRPVTTCEHRVGLRSMDGSGLSVVLAEQPALRHHLWREEPLAKGLVCRAFAEHGWKRVHILLNAPRPANVCRVSPSGFCDRGSAASC